MFVLDASVVASWCFPDEVHPRAEAALRRIAVEPGVAPVLLWFELRNVLLIGERRNRVTPAQTARFLRHVADLPIEVDHGADENAVLGLARTHLLTVYDAVYLELARRRGLSLATLDQALIKAAQAEVIPLFEAGQ
jgi:predicted nucleic acid-binding protein